jgi:hypothetical protein
MDADANLRMEIEMREADIAKLRARSLVTVQQQLAQRDCQLQTLQEQVLMWRHSLAERKQLPYRTLSLFQTTVLMQCLS